ncbi:Response regulator [Candidatus Phaeomarinobacter ectocarpi]|uniref:Response regulator n=1 Tax=Candidatus Phaeomarinibacter ectocarpi TaxID=1458461 RepID=X5MPC9_9HYPH|nr:HD domain-containing phosphohydrolase [Candidatus Phaeomarinobacter ectocarpi]CDO61316.1 Response regulator [Candidatus Phaeomarinobacter ectocarpi]
MPAVHLLNAAHVDALSCVHAAHSATDAHTADHEHTVGLLAKHIATFMGSSPEEAEAIGLAARLHDVGKMSIPPAILHASGVLTPDQNRIMQGHALAGAKILQTAKFPLMRLASQIALEHHEHADGSGYPYGLRNNQTSMASRIVSLCDVYDALRRERSYKPGKTHEEVCQALSNGEGRITPDIFDERVLRTFIEHKETIGKIYIDAVRSTH